MRMWALSQIADADDDDDDDEHDDVAKKISMRPQWRLAKTIKMGQRTLFEVDFCRLIVHFNNLML